MNWKEKTVSRILLIVARMLVDDKGSDLYKDLESLGTHLSYGSHE
jgi:hypothetical protein